MRLLAKIRKCDNDCSRGGRVRQLKTGLLEKVKAQIGHWNDWKSEMWCSKNKTLRQIWHRKNWTNRVLHNFYFRPAPASMILLPPVDRWSGEADGLPFNERWPTGRKTEVLPGFVPFPCPRPLDWQSPGWRRRWAVSWWNRTFQYSRMQYIDHKEIQINANTNKYKKLQI